MGVKRSHAAMADQETPSTSPYMPMFEYFRAELDEHHERRERIIKASRDITAASKKIIFTLHRLRTLNAPLPPSITKANSPYATDISTKFSSISSDLQGLNAHRYARQISGGCQEYIEAASFSHYLTTASLLSYPEAVAQVRQQDPEGPGVELSYEDYLLGIYDFTGELMKFGITAMATTGSLPSSCGDAMDTSTSSTTRDRNLLTDLRTLRADLEALNTGFGPFAKDVDKKMDVMKQSVEKVEKALYGLTVRANERPKGWMPDLSESGGGGRAVEVEG